MQELVELVKLADLDKLKAGGQWSAWFESGSKIEQLCLAILNGDVSTDEEGLHYLYASDVSGNKYYNIRERLKERLSIILALNGIKRKETTIRLSTLTECTQKWSVALALLSRNSTLAAIGMMESLLKQTLRYEFTELSLSITSTLRVYYSTADGGSSKFRHYDDLHGRLRENWLAEETAEHLYANITRQSIETKAYQVSLTQFTQEAYEKVREYSDTCHSFQFQICARLIELKALQGNYTQSMKCCESAIDYFQQKPYDVRIPLQTFYYNLILCYVHLKEFEKGIELIQRYKSSFDEGTFTWFKLQEQAFLLATRTKNYQTAFKVYQSVQPFLKSDDIPAQITEIWKIHEAYIQFLVAADCVEGIEEKDNLRYRPAKFINNIPMYSRDKRGMNIPILIIQILFGVLKRDFSGTIDRIEAIQKYCSRYLKNDETFRSNCFIRMLLQIPEGAFHRAAVKRKVVLLEKQLSKTEQQTSFYANELEIIPYEHLWEILLKTLPEKRFDTTKVVKHREDVFMDA